MKKQLLMILTAVAFTLANVGAEDLPGLKGAVDSFEDLPANGFSQPGDCWYLRGVHQ
jgi:hypothetical protein